jgi:transposase-like protein
MTLNLKSKIYTDETAARTYLESVQWPNGPICPHCGVVNEATELQGKSTRPGVYKCRPCQKPFSVTVGTVFERSKIPLTKWLLATELLTASKKGISSNQLARMLDVTYKTAWFMSMRIREAMTPKDAGRMGGEGMVVEADETELSPSRKSRPRSRAKNLKFVSLVERGGRARSRVLTGKGGAIGNQVTKVLYRELDEASTLHTDGARHYVHTLAAAKHEAINHDKAFARYTDEGVVHTNSAEGFFSIFKRGLVGTYQHMSSQHLHRYLAEFDFRMNHRAKLGIDDTARAQIALKGIQGKRLMYRRPDAA